MCQFPRVSPSSRGRSVFEISVREVSVHLDLKVFKLLAFLCFTRILTEIIQQRICYSFVSGVVLAVRGKSYSFCPVQIFEIAKERFQHNTHFFYKLLLLFLNSQYSRMILSFGPKFNLLHNPPIYIFKLNIYKVCIKCGEGQVHILELFFLYGYFR